MKYKLNNKRLISIITYLKWTIYIIIWSNIIPKSICQTSSSSVDDNNITKFYMDTYGKNNTFTARYHFNYNYDTSLFDEYNQISSLKNIEYFIICNEDDIDKNEDNKNTIIIWNTSTYEYFSSATPFIHAFPIWYQNQKKKGKTFCMRLDSIGWGDTVTKEICNNNTKDCPNIIVLETSQFTHRYYKNETISLNNYFNTYYKDTGKAFESSFNKLMNLDYNVNNNWLAVPLFSDLKILQFNMTTFNYCINHGYNLHYPPPLSDYWGPNYRKTWTWDKAFEYIELIANCTGKPSFKLENEFGQDLKFFSNLCNSLNIPFITEDTELNIKKCGLRNKEYIKKLSLLKKITENHYVESWLNKKDIKKWKKSPYPNTIKKQPTFYPNKQIDISYINGFYYSSIHNYEDKSEIRYAYMPEAHSIMDNSGAVITNNSNFQDESFEFLKILTDEKYPFISEFNNFVTPFENINGKYCVTNSFQYNEINCNGVLTNKGTYPYYYNYNGTVYIIYLTHISENESNNGVFVDPEANTSISNVDIVHKLQQLYNVKFMCPSNNEYKENSIKYYGKYKIELPIPQTNETIILKSMDDISYSHQILEAECSLYDEYMKYAKPIQFPYNNFMEINNMKRKAPISLLFAHLYYKHNNTDPGSFEAIINENCDIIDDALIPDCSMIKMSSIYSGKKLTPSDCDEKDLTMTINYANCKYYNNNITAIGDGNILGNDPINNINDTFGNPLNFNDTFDKNPLNINDTFGNNPLNINDIIGDGSSNTNTIFGDDDDINDDDDDDISDGVYDDEDEEEEDEEQSNGYSFDVKCSYIPQWSIKGLVLVVFSDILIVINVIFYIIIFINRYKKCIRLTGFSSITLISLCNITLNVSMIFWVGKLKDHKCILRIWIIVIGITSFISIFIYRSNNIITFYNNPKLKYVPTYKKNFIFPMVFLTQFCLLLIWTIKHEGIHSMDVYIENGNYYEYQYCSIGNYYILCSIFSIDYILLILLIFLSYRGRKIPNEFNESKINFINSLLIAFYLSIAFLFIFYSMKNISIYPIILNLLNIISFSSYLIFILPKILLIFNINNFSSSSSIIRVVSLKTEKQ